MFQVRDWVLLGVMNNILAMVFSAEFFSPLEPTVAAIYTIPFYSLIIPLRAYQKLHQKRQQKHTGHT